MDPDREEVLSDTEDPIPLRTDEEEEQEEEDQEEEEEEDARIFNAWMQQYRSGDQQQKKDGEQGEEEEEPEAERPASRTSLEPPTHMRAHRRASLPSPVSPPPDPKQRQKLL